MCNSFGPPGMQSRGGRDCGTCRNSSSGHCNVQAVRANDIILYLVVYTAKEETDKSDTRFMFSCTPLELPCTCWYTRALYFVPKAFKVVLPSYFHIVDSMRCGPPAYSVRHAPGSGVSPGPQVPTALQIWPRGGGHTLGIHPLCLCRDTPGAGC